MPMRRDIVGAILLTVVALVSVAAWQSYVGAIERPGWAGAPWSLVWFSLLWTVFLVGAVVWEGSGWRLAAAGMFLLPGLWFEHSVTHTAVSVVAVILFLAGLRSVQNETSDRIRFRFSKNVSAGYPVFFFAFAVVLSSAYYVHLRDARWEELVPRFRLGEGMAAITVQMLGLTNPQMREHSDRNLTVDEFLSAVQAQDKNDASGMSGRSLPSDLSDNLSYVRPDKNPFVLDENEAALSDLVEAISMDAKRQQLGELVGRPVVGDERIADVFAEGLQRKLVALRTGENVSDRLSSRAIPLFLGALFLLTVWPLCSLLGVLWGRLGGGLFWLLRQSGVIRVERRPAEREVLRIDDQV